MSILRTFVPTKVPKTAAHFLLRTISLVLFCRKNSKSICSFFYSEQYPLYFFVEKSTKNACSMSATGSAPPRFSRSADSRRGYFVSLRSFFYTLHLLLPHISDVEKNQLTTTGQADSIFFSKNVAVITRLMCSAVWNLFHYAKGLGFAKKCER